MRSPRETRSARKKFAIRAERNDIRQIEKALGVRLTPREAGMDLEREEKSAQKTVVIPIHRHQQKHPGGSFAPRGRRRFGSR